MKEEDFTKKHVTCGKNRGGMIRGGDVHRKAFNPFKKTIIEKANNANNSIYHIDLNMVVWKANKISETFLNFFVVILVKFVI
jgi:hypothetical protein